jgi:hypothetical protein
VPQGIPVPIADELLTPAEGIFYRALRVAAADRWHIAAKVRLADLVAPPGGREWQAAWNRIAAKHVDFVLCEPATLRPCLAIELDDRSHRRPDRVERDAFVDRVFADAALPILHVPVRRAYDALALASQIGASLGDPPASDAPGEEDRRCERCGGEMRKRVARRGQHAGGAFWGCTNFPRCRHIVPLGG